MGTSFLFVIRSTAACTMRYPHKTRSLDYWYRVNGNMIIRSLAAPWLRTLMHEALPSSFIGLWHGASRSNGLLFWWSANNYWRRVPALRTVALAAPAVAHVGKLNSCDFKICHFGFFNFQHFWDFDICIFRRLGHFEILTFWPIRYFEMLLFQDLSFLRFCIFEISISSDLADARILGFWQASQKFKWPSGWAQTGIARIWLAVR